MTWLLVKIIFPILAGKFHLLRLFRLYLLCPRVIANIFLDFVAEGKDIGLTIRGDIAV